MKSTEFIQESIWDDDGDLFWTEQEWIQIVKLIHKDCKPFLKQAKGQVVYRGMKENQEFLKQKVRLTNREPRDMPGDIHDKLNQYFLMKHGAQFRNALFLSGDVSQAETYGELYRIYPLGKFEFLWSPKVDDLYSEWESMYVPNRYEMPDEEADKIELKLFHDKVLKNNYRTSNLAQAIASGNEIMLRCKSYYAVSSEGFNNLPDEWKSML